MRDAQTTSEAGSEKINYVSGGTLQMLNAFQSAQSRQGADIEPSTSWAPRSSSQRSGADYPVFQLVPVILASEELEPLSGSSSDHDSMGLEGHQTPGRALMLPY